MNAPFMGLIFPSLVITLFTIGCLTLLLRKNGFQALLGMALVALAPALFLAEIGVRAGNSEGSLLAVLLVFATALHLWAGFFLVQWLGDTTGNMELDRG